MIYKLKIEIETDDNVTYEQVLKAIESCYFTEGELFNIMDHDAIFTSITKIEETI